MLCHIVFAIEWVTRLFAVFTYFSGFYVCKNSFKVKVNASELLQFVALLVSFIQSCWLYWGRGGGGKESVDFLFLQFSQVISFSSIIVPWTNHLFILTVFGSRLQNHLLLYCFLVHSLYLSLTVFFFYSMM